VTVTGGGPDIQQREHHDHVLICGEHQDRPGMFVFGLAEDLVGLGSKTTMGSCRPRVRCW